MEVSTAKWTCAHQILYYRYILVLIILLILCTLSIPDSILLPYPYEYQEKMGALDHLSDLFDCSHGRSKLKKRKQLQTVEIKVRIDCEGCERKVRRAVEGMKGVKQVDIEPKANKVTVVGYVEPSKVVARVAHRTGKKAELWPYVPYDVVAHPYAPGVYDKKAPAGYVRNAEDPQVSQLARASSIEVRYTTAFSDENPAACAIM